MLTLVQHSKYISLVLIIPKKEGNLRFLKDYCRINQKLVRKPHPLPIKGETMQKLEGLKYATSSDINMEHYTISLSPTSQYMTTIVTEFWKFR